MLYMLIERYTNGPKPIYERAAVEGRMLPEGLHYVDSWVVDDDNLDRCFQLMETSDPSLFDEWLSKWADLCEFEILPVITSSDAATRLDLSWSGDGT